MDKIELLIKELKTVREKYGYSLQKPAIKIEIKELNKKVQSNYDIELSGVYEFILLRSNGFNENGVFLYGTKTHLIEGYSDRYLDGLTEATEMWHENEDCSDYLFYGDADSYFFTQSFKNRKYFIHDKENFNDIIYETQSDYDFFEKILKLAVEDGFYIE